MSRREPRCMTATGARTPACRDATRAAQSCAPRFRVVRGDAPHSEDAVALGTTEGEGETLRAPPDRPGCETSAEDHLRLAATVPQGVLYFPAVAEPG
eukprot:6426266-Alexandrium_andersonii.AAC.1